MDIINYFFESVFILFIYYLLCFTKIRIENIHYPQTKIINKLEILSTE